MVVTKTLALAIAQHKRSLFLTHKNSLEKFRMSRVLNFPVIQGTQAEGSFTNCSVWFPNTGRNTVGVWGKSMGAPWPGLEKALVLATHTPLTNLGFATPDPGDAGSSFLAVSWEEEENGTEPAD